MENKTNTSVIREWFADELDERMRESNIEPYHIALLCKVNIAIVEEYLEGRSLPDPWQMILLAETLECTVNDLLGFGEVSHPVVYEPYAASDMYMDGNAYALCFSDRLEVYMHNRGFSAPTLANATGIELRVIRSWLRNRPKLPTMSQLINVIEAFKCTPSDLLGY